MVDLYILDGTMPQRIHDEQKWLRWHEANSNIVAREKVGDMEVSTCFLGLNLERNGGPPKLFVSMISDDSKKRCYGKNSATWDEAVACHQHAVEMAEAGLMALAQLKRGPG